VFFEMMGDETGLGFADDLGSTRSGGAIRESRRVGPQLTGT